MPSKFTKEKLERLGQTKHPNKMQVHGRRSTYPCNATSISRNLLEFTLRFECLDGVDCPPCLPAETITRLKVGKPPAEASFLVVFQHAARLISEDFSVCLPFLDVGFDWLHVVLSFIDRTLHPLSRVS